MKFTKKIYTLVLTVVMVLSLSVTAFATPVDDIRAALEKGGIPADQTGKVIEYLQKVNISQAQANDALAKVDGAVAKLNGQTDLGKVSAEVRNSIKGDISSAVSVLGLKADFSTKSSTGATMLVLTDNNGNKILSGDASSSAAMLNSLDVNAIKAAITSAQAFSNNSEKGKFVAVNGAPMKKTATNYGTFMAIAALMMVAGGAVVVYNRRTVANN